MSSNFFAKNLRFIFDKFETTSVKAAILGLPVSKYAAFEDGTAEPTISEFCVILGYIPISAEQMLFQDLEAHYQSRKAT